MALAHDHRMSDSYGNHKKMAFVFGLTISYMVVEVIAGLSTKNIALLADAGKSFGFPQITFLRLRFLCISLDFF